MRLGWNLLGCLLVPVVSWQDLAWWMRPQRRPQDQGCSQQTGRRTSLGCRRRSDKPTPCPTAALATVVPAPCWPPATCPAVAWRPGALCPALQPTGPQDPEASPPVSPTEPTEQPAAVQWSLRGALSAGVPTRSSSLPGLQRFPTSLVGPLGFPPRNLQTDRTLCSGATRTCSPCSPPPVH